MKIEKNKKTYIDVSYFDVILKINEWIWESTDEDNYILIKVNGINKVVFKNELKKL